MKNTRSHGLFGNKIIRVAGALTGLLMLTLINASTLAGVITTSVSTDSAKNAVFAEAKLMLVRMDEINAMDKATFSQAEKKQLRKEVRMIKGNLKELDKGMYMPVGTLVILLFIPLIVFNLIQ